MERLNRHYDFYKYYNNGLPYPLYRKQISSRSVAPQTVRIQTGILSKHYTNIHTQSYHYSTHRIYVATWRMKSVIPRIGLWYSSPITFDIRPRWKDIGLFRQDATKSHGSLSIIVDAIHNIHLGAPSLGSRCLGIPVEDIGSHH